MTTASGGERCVPLHLPQVAFDFRSKPVVLPTAGVADVAGAPHEPD